MDEELLNYKKYINFSNKIIFDIGANEGLMIQFFINNNADKVIAVEPQLDNLRILQSKFSNNEKVDIIDGVISTYNGKTIIGIEKQERVNGLYQGHITNNGTDLQKRIWNQKIEVNCLTLESISYSPTIIKMDIEGYEHIVIPNSIMNIHPKYWLIEIHSWEDLKQHGWNISKYEKENDSLIKILNNFKNNGYTKFIPAKVKNILKINNFGELSWEDIKLGKYKKDNKKIYYKVVNLIITY